MILPDPQFQKSKIPTHTYDVFISHASEDSPWCEKLVERLKKRKLKVWFDGAQLRGPGGSLTDAINEGLAMSRRVVLVMTPAYFDKDWTRAEAAFALNQDPSGRRQFVIPVLRETCKIPPLLSAIKHLDFRDDTLFNENCRVLVGVLSRPTNGFVPPNWLKPGGFVPEPILPAQPNPRRVPEAKLFPATRKRRSYVLGSIAMILLLGLALLAINKNFLSVGTGQTMEQRLNLELPPFIQGLLSIDSFAALRDSLAQVDDVEALKHQMESRNAGTLVCHGNCFEIGVAGDVVRYFAIKIDERSFDLKSGRFLSEAALAEPALKKHALLFHFIQAQTIVENQPPPVQKRLRETESLFSKTDGDRHPQ